MQQRFVAARKTHHRLVDRLVAVRIEAHRLADDVRGFGASAGQEAHFIHGIQQLPVRGLEAVDLRDGAGNNDRHGVGHVVRFQRLTDRLLHGRAVQPLHLRVCPFFRFRFFFLCHLFSSFANQPGVTTRPADRGIYSRFRRCDPFVPPDCRPAAGQRPPPCGRHPLA